MAEVKRVPQWVMLEALRNNASFLALEKSSGAITGSATVSPADFDIDTAVAEPVLRLSSETTKTSQVDAGETIVAIVLWIDNTNAPAAYDTDGDEEIRYPIVDVDGNGEYFPDGGSIDTTEFEVYLNDL
jgi:hypothetical protein